MRVMVYNSAHFNTTALHLKLLTAKVNGTFFPQHLSNGIYEAIEKKIHARTHKLIAEKNGVASPILTKLLVNKKHTVSYG